MHNTPHAVVYADAQGIIGFCNKGAERIFGFPAGEELGQSLDIIIPDGLRKRHWSGYSETVRAPCSPSRHCPGMGHESRSSSPSCHSTTRQAAHSAWP